jgi:putative flippase GtrA
MAVTAQFLCFAAAGGVAALANFGSRFLFSLWLPYAAAIVLAYLLGMTVAFLLMREFVFRGATRNVAQQVASFAGVNALAVLQTLCVSVLLARWALPAAGLQAHAEAVAHAVGVAVPVFTSFLAHRAFTFK